MSFRRLSLVTLASTLLEPNAIVYVDLSAGVVNNPGIAKPARASMSATSAPMVPPPTTRAVDLDGLSNIVPAIQKHRRDERHR
ncbi:MAG: hypothetical protein LH481_06390, partial [Burkholderiales bacterium]|nr:hypothetical protein [Burkholderiales bacterium]